MKKKRPSLTRAQAARHLGVPEQTIYSQVRNKSGLGKHFKLNRYGKLVVPMSEVEKYENQA